MELKSGILSFRLNTSLAFTQVDLLLGLSYCNGKWNKVIIKKEGSFISTSMNGLMKHTSESGAQPLVVNSPVYVGGIPQELLNSYQHLCLEQGKFHWRNSQIHTALVLTDFGGSVFQEIAIDSG